MRYNFRPTRHRYVRHGKAPATKRMCGGGGSGKAVATVGAKFENMRSFKQWMSSWKADDFFRQLATVIIGIVVTFGGSGMIRRNAQKREAGHLLEMVGQELKLNAQGALMQAEQFEHLKNGAVAFRPYLDDPRAVPIDTLRKYYDILNSNIYPPSTDAFEILKSSEAIDAIKDKPLLFELFLTYTHMGYSASNVRNYTELKLALRQKYEDSVERDMVETVFAPTDLHAKFVREAGSPFIARYILESAKEDGWLDGLIEEHKNLAAKIDTMVVKIDAEIN